MRPFRDGTPYQGEDLISADSAPDDFTARCSRSGVGNTGMCLLQRRIGDADITVRFPRDWLSDWKKVLYGIDRRTYAATPELGEIDVEDRQFEDVGAPALFVLDEQHADELLADIGLERIRSSSAG